MREGEHAGAQRPCDELGPSLSALGSHGGGRQGRDTLAPLLRC